MEISEHSEINFFAFIKEHLTLIIIGIYTLSFINFYIYYKSFNISIFNYLGISDLLFFSFEYVFQFFLVIVISEIILFIVFGFIFTAYEKFTIYRRKGKLYFLSNKKNRERIRDVFSKSFSPALKQFRFGIIFLSIFALIFLPYKLILIPAFFVYFLYYLDKIASEKIINLTIVMIIGVIFISMLVTTLVNSYNKRFEKDNEIISFVENGNFISTDKMCSTYNYLGETSTHIFLYDIENKESKIFSKDNLTNLRIQNPNTIDNHIKSIKNSWLYKYMIEIYYQ